MRLRLAHPEPFTSPNGGNRPIAQNKQKRNLNRWGDRQMQWMHWLLVIPGLGAWLFIFVLVRAGAPSTPMPTPPSSREPDRMEESAKESPALRRRHALGLLYRGFSAQTGHVRFLAETRRRRAHGPEAGDVVPR